MYLPAELHVYFTLELAMQCGPQNLNTEEGFLLTIIGHPKVDF